MARKQSFQVKFLLLWIYSLLYASVCGADEVMNSEQLDSWFEREESNATEMVSEGELRFLPERPGKPVLHSINRLMVSEESLDDGWVGLIQCYENLDPVAESEVVYRYKAMRELKIDKSKNIGAAEIKGQSIQLKQVQKEAELCISAMVRIFYLNPDGSYSLINGPFHRRFLDGYFPYHLTLEVVYPPSKLEVKYTIPVEQSGFSVKQDAGKLVFDVVFEGILNIEIVFQAK